MDTLLNKSLPKLSLSGDILKLIAAIAMIIDHSAYCLLHYYLMQHYMDIVPQTYTKLNNLYEICRGIGRIAFPIFCFFLVEGFFRTRNVYKYLTRLMIFALISEVPFDLAHFKVPLEGSHQNVMLELAIGLVMMIALKYIENITGLSDSVRWICIICAIIAFADFAYLCNTDYNAKGILIIAVIYIFKSTGALNLIAGAAVTGIFEKYGPISFLLLYFYNPDTKPRFKYFFYAFYPVHLALIYLIALLLFQ